MTPFEFGQLVGAGFEKEAVGGAMGARLMKVLGGLRSAGTTINSGAKNLLRGSGTVLSGLGTGVSATGEAGKGMGRLMMQGGQRLSAGASGNLPGGIAKDLAGAVGLTTRAGGRVSRYAGQGLDLAGRGLQAAGRGLNNLAETSYGIPTVAAAGLGYAGMSALPRLPGPTIPRPNVRFNWPVEVDVNYRRPVDVNWR